MAFYRLVALLSSSHGSILLCTAHGIGTDATASVSPMDNNRFRVCLRRVVLLHHGPAGYAFFEPRASKAKAPWVLGEKVSMNTCVERGLCTYRRLRDLTQGTQFKIEWKTGDIVSTCMADYQAAISATLYTLGNTHRAVQIVPFLGAIMEFVRQNGREIAKRSGEKGAAIAAREEVAVAGSSYDLQQGILEALNDCVQQLEEERQNLFSINIDSSVEDGKSTDEGGEDLLWDGKRSYCEEVENIRQG
eukprot:TRINITY_DN3986_c0_g1_i1.p1 TRINITY_DN3986_c0_g1~~TRINITY_DN3986_c0_g1_i1.p1  ORF type:complete len:247 (-),score=19.61 TRINITY_DN3986_c0_g1_i1:222-962(-)